MKELDDYIPQYIKDEYEKLGKDVNKISAIEKALYLIDPYVSKWYADKLEEDFEHFAEVGSRPFKEGD